MPNKNYYHSHDIVWAHAEQAPGRIVQVVHAAVFCIQYCIRKRFMSDKSLIIPVSGQIDHLGLLRKGDCARVTGLAAVVGEEQVAMRMRLLELGFAPGEPIRVVAESFPRRDPMAVRIGNATFALRRYEAAMVYIERTQAE